MSHIAIADEQVNTRPLTSNDLEIFKTYLDNKLENQELNNLNTFYIAFGSLLISLLTGITLYFMGYAYSAKKANIQTKEEGRKIRKKLKLGFGSISGSQDKIQLASKSIKKKTKKLHGLANTINSKFDSILEMQQSDISSELKNLRGRLEEYRYIADSLEIKNNLILSEYQQSKSFISQLETALNKNNAIESSLSSLVLSQSDLQSNLQEMQRYMAFNHNLLKKVSDESISRNELVSLLNNSINELVITRRKPKGSDSIDMTE